MTVGDHRLAASQAMNLAEAAEEARQSTHAPTSGSDPGVTLDGATTDGLDSLGMTPDALLPGPGDPEQVPS